MPPSPVRIARRLGLAAADRVVTLPVLRWTWRSLADEAFGGELPEFRPADREAIRDMMGGRYLLANRLVETGGASPFSIEAPDDDWWQSLHAFGWLRHFGDVRDPGERRFARTLVLDWIGREGQQVGASWVPALCAQRILNWLRHLPLLTEGATPGEARTIQRLLGIQVQSLKIRGRLAADPLDRLFSAIALLGAELCERTSRTDVPARLQAVTAELAGQLSEDGLHLSRNARVQLQLLVELLSVRRAASGEGTEALRELGAHIGRMHESLDALTLGTGEPAYFQGAGQMQHDILIAIQSNGPSRRRRTGTVGGFAILREGDATLIADTGLRQPPGFEGEAHASSLAFEFSHGSDLLVGNCGPAPAQLADNRRLFCQGVAHSGPTIDGEDIPGITTAPVTLNAADHTMLLRTDGPSRRFGVALERQLTLVSGGTTLVGQDRMLKTGKPTGRLSVRFHLAPGARLERRPEAGLVRLTLGSGAIWSFLWEGAELHEEDSVRQSASRGFHRTRQLVLEAAVRADAEIAWIFTREQG